MKTRWKTTRQLALEELARIAERLSVERNKAGHFDFEREYLDVALFLWELAGHRTAHWPKPVLGQLSLLDR